MDRIGLYEWTVVLIGMGTTFLALISLSLILNFFSLTAGFFSRRRKKDELTDPAADGVTPEHIAVIAAAAAAASGRPASGIRIARITPSVPGISGLDTPVWGYADRLTVGFRGQHL